MKHTFSIKLPLRAHSDPPHALEAATLTIKADECVVEPSGALSFYEHGIDVRHPFGPLRELVRAFGADQWTELTRNVVLDAEADAGALKQ